MRHRYDYFVRVHDELLRTEGSLDAFSRGYERFGFTVTPEGGITYREWAPGAQEAYLIGDFSKRSAEGPSPRTAL